MSDTLIQAVVTTAGAQMLSKCISYHAVNFAKAEVGSDAYASAALAKAATALKAKNAGANVSISNVSYTGDAAQISVQLTTSGMDASQSMTIREIGVYLSDPEDSSTSVLACYAWYTDPTKADVISGGALFNRIYDIVMAISTADSLAVTSTPTGFQETISAEGILVGDGNGNVTAAVGVTVYTATGETYSKGSHTHNLDGSNNDASLTGTLPITKGGTGKTTLAEAQTALGITKVIYSSTTPTVVNGAIWLQPTT